MATNLICSKCGAKLGHGKNKINVKRHVEYEGLDIAIFNCPVCGVETNDLQCNYEDDKTTTAKEL